MLRYRTGLITQLQHDRGWEGSAALCKKPLARRSREPFLAMVRLECLLYAAGLTALGAGKTDAFYLPGGAPNSFVKGTKVSRPSSDAAALRSLHCLLRMRGCLGTDSLGTTISLVMCIARRDQRAFAEALSLCSVLGTVRWYVRALFPVWGECVGHPLSECLDKQAAGMTASNHTRWIVRWKAHVGMAFVSCDERVGLSGLGV